MHILIEHKLKYLNRRLIEIEELKNALSSGDFSVAISIGHRLKGNGETFGFPQISTIGIQMEIAGQGKDMGKLNSLIQELADLVHLSLNEINSPAM